MVERRQIFHRPSAPGHNDHIHTVSFIEIANPGGYFIGCHFTLHLRWKNQHICALMASLQDVENVSQSSRLRRGHNPNPPGQSWNEFLARGIEQSLSFQLGF